MPSSKIFEDLESMFIKTIHKFYTANKMTNIYNFEEKIVIPVLSQDRSKVKWERSHGFH